MQRSSIAWMKIRTVRSLNKPWCFLGESSQTNNALFLRGEASGRPCFSRSQLMLPRFGGILYSVVGIFDSDDYNICDAIQEQLTGECGCSLFCFLQVLATNFDILAVSGAPIEIRGHKLSTCLKNIHLEKLIAGRSILWTDEPIGVHIFPSTSRQLIRYSVSTADILIH